MKKFVLCFFSGLMVFSFSTIVYAEGTYFSGNIGAAVATDSDVTDQGGNFEIESDTGIAFGAAVGYAYGNNIRMEAELAYQKNDIDQVNVPGVGSSVTAGGDTSSYALLLNGYYDFTNNSAFTPFISAGIGYAKVEVNDFIVNGIPIGSEEDKVFAYQVGAGVGYAISETLILDLKYRYFATADPKFDTAEAEYASHNFYVGIRAFF
ncbi:MAG: OmpW family outer membrane protein [Bacteroidota bacterium]